MSNDTHRSVDPKEVAKFSALAAEWWDQQGKFAPLHRLNPVRLAFIRDVALTLTPSRAADARPSPGGGGGRGESIRSGGEQAQALDALTPSPAPPPSRGRGRTTASTQRDVKRRALAGLRVLDLGCGGGLVSVPLARLGATMTGVDASEETIEAAKAHARDIGLEIDYRVGTAESLAGEIFDLVLALEIVEHVADVGAFLRACANLIRPGGKLIVSTINRTALARALALFGAERLFKWIPEGTHEYEKLVTPEELVAAAPELRWEAPVGLSFDPVQRAWKLSRDVSVNYFRVASRPA